MTIMLELTPAALVTDANDEVIQQVIQKYSQVSIHHVNEP